MTIPAIDRSSGQGLSVNDYLKTIPERRRYTYDVKGKLLLFPRTDMVMVPYEMHSDGSWSCVVVLGNDTYKPDGYSLWVSEDEIRTAVEIDLVTAALEHYCCSGTRTSYCARCQSDPRQQALANLRAAVQPHVIARIEEENRVPDA